ncbi:MAG: hypothetical protein A2X84_00175 [Desulfuromonadaceae bacterium GWC2_58_13]|nr:MAG: hypothetical protein A2X84_00175 [Desulfuromonadaceae bacterium GWC2_58_13]
MKRKLTAIFSSTLFLLLVSASLAMALTPKEELGKLLYFDKHLSIKKNQACASCHHPRAGWSDPLNAAAPDMFPVSLGSVRTLNGCRNAPPSGYAAFNPVFSYDEASGLYSGGQFWDGRADTLKDQAMGPFMNPVEMGMPSKAAVIQAIAEPKNRKASIYCKLFMQVYGIDLKSINYNDPDEIDMVYEMVADAIGIFEKTERLTSFTSKYDSYLAGNAQLTAQELNGLALFEGKAGCNLCHPSAATANLDGTIVPPLFTDFTYDNLGVPTNDNRLLVDCGIDNGLGGRLVTGVDPNADLQVGKFKVSSLRNIELTAPYTHNGFFATLEEIVRFYNTRDVANWPLPEVSDNLNITELGNLGLTADEEADLVAFLLTLTDGFCKNMPDNFVLPEMTVW